MHVCFRVKNRRWRYGLDKLHDLYLRFRIGLDISLSSPKVGMSSEHLNVSQRATDGRDLPSRISNEGAPTTVTGAAVETDVLIPPPEQVDDGLGRHPVGSLALNQVVATDCDGGFRICGERDPKLVVHRYDPSRLTLTCCIL